MNDHGENEDDAIRSDGTRFVVEVMGRKKPSGRE